MNSQSVVVSEVSTDARTRYDLQSNGSSFMLWKNPSNALEMHACFMIATDPGPNWADRNIRYFYSNDGGVTWDYLGPVSATRSGFPCLGITYDSRAVIGLQTNTSFQIYVDLGQGTGNWQPLNLSPNYIWGNLAVNHSNNNIFFTSKSFLNDSAYVNVCTNINPPQTFSGYKAIAGSVFVPTAVAVGTGRAGVAYITSDASVKIIESTDGGVTWGAPVTIWNWRASDSTGAFRGIDLEYNVTVPQVVFELCHVEPVSGTYDPRLPSKIVFWSPGVNNGNVMTIDSAAGLSGSNPVNDAFVSVCRPVIGRSNNAVTFVAYCRARLDTSSLGNNFFDIYVSCILNGGMTWSTPNQLTNRAGQFSVLHDCRYVSAAPVSSSADFLFQADTIPGSSVNGASSSWAKMYLVRGSPWVPCIPFGIQSSSNEIPEQYILKQNYPNPFNPVTQIEFALPKESHVRIVIYNSLGEAIDVIADQTLKAGSYKADWNAARYASGVYFYEIAAGDFTQTKKMVLIK